MGHEIRADMRFATHQAGTTYSRAESTFGVLLPLDEKAELTIAVVATASRSVHMYARMQCPLFGMTACSSRP